MRTLHVCFLLLVLQALAFPATIHVPDDYATIQGAIEDAANGDTIIVRPGTYHELVDFLGKAIVVRSEMGPKTTIIHAGSPGSVVTFKNGEGRGSVIEGFTITEGSGTEFAGDKVLEYYGGGIICYQSSPTITGNVVTDNDTRWNRNGYGGGIACLQSSPAIIDNLITENYAHVATDGKGGGIYCRNHSSPEIIGNLIKENDAGEAGGIMCDKHSSPAIVNNVIVKNRVGYTAGAVYCREYSSPTLINNTITDNNGFWYSCGIVSFDSSPTIVNTILWGNYGTKKQYNFHGTGNPGIYYSAVEGGAPGAGNIAADPLLLDFHITYNSPCRNAGYNAVVTETTDGEGDPRIVDGVVDIGADEYWFHLYAGNSAIPGDDITIRTVGMPGDPVMLALGSGIQDPPQSTQYGDLYLIMPPVWKGSVGAIPPSGILDLEMTVPSGWSPGQKKPFQALVGPQGDPASKLTNLMVLEIE